MTTARENILQALFEVLQTVTGPVVLRNEVLPEKIPNGGLIILRDGDPGEAEVTLSPLSYYWQHRAVLEVIVTGADAAARDTALDDLFASISTAINADRTLGGVCDLVTPQAPDTSALAIEGAAGIKAATVAVELIYVTADQLG
jgi:hypothetical protein